MKKLDEIMELMADEMADFKTNLLHLQKISGELQKQSIPISTEVLEKHLNSFFQKQQEKEVLAVEKLNAIDEKLKNAYILPKSLGKIYGSILILLIILIGYLSFELVQMKNADSEVNNVVQKEQQLYSRYFQNHPEVKKVFKIGCLIRTSHNAPNAVFTSRLTPVRYKNSIGSGAGKLW